MQAALIQAAEAIRRNQNFVITTHVNPDGDGIGSEIGLYRYLQDLNKTVHIINSSPTPRKYQFLDPHQEVVLFDPSLPCAPLLDAEVIFILDISRWERLGPMREITQHHRALKVCIDHHPVCGDFADVNLICQEACASGELVLDLITYMEGKLNARIAEALYSAIITDTGVFRFPNTNEHTHRAAARLLETGISASVIYEQIYERCSPQRVKLMAMAMFNLEYLHSGQLAWTVITQEMLRETGVQPEEVDGFVDTARGIRNVLASFLFLELPDGSVKISLRSKEDVDVNRFAARFGGGGHRHASGILLNGPINDAVDTVLSQSGDLFEIAQERVS